MTQSALEIQLRLKIHCGLIVVTSRDLSMFKNNTNVEMKIPKTIVILNKVKNLFDEEVLGCGVRGSRFGVNHRGH